MCCLFVNYSPEHFNNCDERDFVDASIVNDYNKFVKMFSYEEFPFAKFCRNKSQIDRGFKSRVLLFFLAPAALAGRKC